MIISMKPDATQDQIDHVCERIREFGYKVHSIQGEERVVIGVIGVGDVTACLEAIEVAPGVASAVRISSPFKFVIKEFKQQRTQIPINGVSIGGDQFVVMAGPCSVESEKQIMEAAEFVASVGGKILRGGAFKPRTSPYSFQGLGEDALKLLKEVATTLDMRVITEVLSSEDLPLIEKYADILQVGTRNMFNYSLLKSIGKIRKPVLLKRGFMATIDEFILAAEYIYNGGNEQIILCERGIRTFETQTRNTLDISAIPILKMETSLPVIVDISHSLGRKDIVLPIAHASLAAGADGLMFESHFNPAAAWSDSQQQLDLKESEDLIRYLEKYFKF